MEALLIVVITYFWIGAFLAGLFWLTGEWDGYSLAARIAGCLVMFLGWGPLFIHQLIIRRGKNA
jgi:hypothetical protein